MREKFQKGKSPFHAEGIPGLWQLRGGRFHAVPSEEHWLIDGLLQDKMTQKRASLIPEKDVQNRGGPFCSGHDFSGVFQRR